MKRCHNCKRDHLIHVQRRGVDLILVRGGRLAYLWIGDDRYRYCATFTGPRTLEKIARAILAEVPKSKRRVKR